MRGDPEQFGLPEPNFSLSPVESLINLFIAEQSEAADREKRLNVRINHLAKLVQTLSKKVVDVKVSPKKSALVLAGASSSSCSTVLVGKNVRTPKHRVPARRTRSISDAADPASSPRAGNQSRTRRTTGGNSEGSDTEKESEHAEVMSTGSSRISGVREIRQPVYDANSWGDSTERNRLFPPCEDGDDSWTLVRLCAFGRSL